LALLRSVIGEGAAGSDAAALGDHWQLDRKLRDCLISQEIPADEAGKVISIMRLVLSRTCPEDIYPYQVPSLGAALVSVNYQMEDFRSLLGVNLFEDTVWFNKEAFEEALFYGSLFMALEGEAAFEAVRRPAPRTGKEKTGPDSAGKRREVTAAAADSRWLTRLENIAKITDQFEKAEKDSGYKLERLIEFLSEGAGHASGGVNAGGKKAAPRKTTKKT
jgi:hypothetical protein